MAKNWAIVIGINNYSNLQPLQYAESDAELIRDFFVDEAGFDEVFLFTEKSPEIQAYPSLISTKPTYGNLRRFLRAQFEAPLLEAGSNLWFFFAGHGQREADGDYLMLSDTDPGDVKHTAIPISYVTERLRRSGADNVVLLFDACRNEGARSGLGIGYEQHQGTITIFSCSPTEKSWEIEKLKQGSFTYALLEGFRIQSEGNCATVERLYQHLSYRVPELNRQYGKPRQNPYLQAEPPYKMYFILLDKHATLKDAEPLKMHALTAEAEGNLTLAEQLWIRVSVVSPGDMDVVRGLKRIAKRQLSQLEIPSQRVIVTSESEVKAPTSAPESAAINTSPIVHRVLQPVPQEESSTSWLWRSPDGTVFRKIPAGEFMRGGTKYPDERPVHEVKFLQPFYLATTPVTNAQFLEFCRATRYSGKHKNFLLHIRKDFFPRQWKDPNAPIVFVAWEDAKEYILWRSEKDDLDYRLATEAQWEYACRAGTRTVYPWGNLYDRSQLNANEVHDHPTPVGSYPPNLWGLFDMLGNTWEWCEDYKDVLPREESIFYRHCVSLPKDSCINPVNTDPAPMISPNVQSGLRVVRGGSFVSEGRNVRPANRRGQPQESCVRSVGFRLTAYGVPESEVERVSL